MAMESITKLWKRSRQKRTKGKKVAERELKKKNRKKSAMAADDGQPPFPLPAVLTHPSSAPPELVTQGAEARLYRTTYLAAGVACALKHRPAKPWRHPALDARLTRHRILAEARVLARCRRAGVPVPALYALDERAGWLAMEWVRGGRTARQALAAWLEARRRREGGDAGPVTGEEEGEGEVVAVLRRIAQAVGRLHAAGVVHGDLTTSNMMLRPWATTTSQGDGALPPPANGVAGGDDHHEEKEKRDNGEEEEEEEEEVVDLDGEVVIIDFGLASQSTSDEDRAVDLYVLERAFASTHPRAEALFTRVLEGGGGEGEGANDGPYRGAFRGAPVVLKKLEEVRMRGRKRSMLG
ncbi:tyrosine protein kinase [Xylariaceae sp. FL0804]|nr:tyrosine protein kinase [Xylariaceae sp. FL0804]